METDRKKQTERQKKVCYDFRRFRAVQNNSLNDSTQHSLEPNQILFKRPQCYQQEKYIDALLARGSKGNGNYWPKSKQQDKGFPNTRTKSEYLGILFPTTRIEASNSQLPLDSLANSDIPLVVIIDLLLLENIVEKTIIHK